MNEIRIPRENANDDSVLILKVNYSTGDIIKKGDTLIEYETSKAVIEFDSPFDGKISEILAIEGEEIEIDAVFMKLNDGGKIDETSSKESNRPSVPNTDKKNIDNNIETDPKINSAELRNALELSSSSEQIEDEANSTHSNENEKNIRKLLGLDELSNNLKPNEIVKNEIADSITAIKSNNSIHVSDEVSAMNLDTFPVDSNWLTSHDLSLDAKRLSNNSVPNSVPNSLRDELKTISNKKNISLVKHPPRKRTEIESLDKSAAAKYQSCLSVNINSGKRKVESFIFESSILDIVTYEIKNLLSGEYNFLNKRYVGDGHVELYEEIIPGVAFDSGESLTVCSIVNSSNMNLHGFQERLSGLMERYETKKFLDGELEPSTFTVSDLSNTNIETMFPLISSGQPFIIGITKQENSFKLFGTFDHRVTEGFNFSKFLNEVSRRTELYFQDDNSSALKKCFMCSTTSIQASKFGRHGLLVIETEDGQKTICRNCFDG